MIDSTTVNKEKTLQKDLGAKNSNEQFNMNEPQLQRTGMVARMRDMQKEKSCVGGIPKSHSKNGFAL